MGSFAAALFDALLSAGVSREHARTVVDLFDRSIDERYGLHAQVLATKQDIAELETRLVRELADIRESIARTNERIADTDARLAGMNERIAGTDARLASMNEHLANMNERIAGTDAHIAGTHARIAEVKSELVKWMLAALTAQTALLLGAIRLF